MGGRGGAGLDFLLPVGRRFHRDADEQNAEVPVFEVTVERDYVVIEV